MASKRQIVTAALVALVLGLSGCQSGSLGKLALFNRGDSASATPNVGQQKFNSLSQQLPGDQRAATAMGGQRPTDNGGFISASWKKTTAAVSGALGTKPKGEIQGAEDDPLRLDRQPKKIGPEVYVSAAKVMENQGKFADAEQHYQKALQAAPGDLNALVGLARLYDRQGRSAEAVETYQRAIKANPNSSLVYNDLGLCHRRQRQLDKSIQALSKAIELQPENAKYRNNLAAALIDAGRPDDALQQLKANTPEAVAEYNVGYLLQQKGDKAQSQRHFERAWALDPSLTDAREMLAQLGVRPKAVQPTASPATPSAEQMQPDANVAYVAAAPDQTIYTSAPKIDVAGEAPPPSYHIGDEAASVADADRQAPLPSTSQKIQDLPPTE